MLYFPISPPVGMKSARVVALSLLPTEAANPHLSPQALTAIEAVAVVWSYWKPLLPPSALARPAVGRL